MSARSLSVCLFLSLLVFSTVPAWAAAPVNDNCANATAVALGTFSGSTLNATPDGSSSCAGESSNDVWYNFTAPETGTVVLTTAGSSFDTVLSVYTGCPGNDTTQIVCDDDSGPGPTSRLSISAVAGTSYVVRVAGYSMAEDGNYSLTIAKESSISGTVTDASTSAPIPATEIDIFDGTGVFVASTTTADTGAYTVPGLVAGKYYAGTFNSHAHVDQVYNNKDCAFQLCSPTIGDPINAGIGDNPGINFALKLGGLISGTLTDASNGTPLSDVAVNVYNSTGVFYKTSHSDSSGVYTVDGLPAGSMFARTVNTLGMIDEIFDNIPCVGNCDPTTGTSIGVALGATTSGIDFALSRGGTLSGSISSSGNAVQGATINVYNSNGTLVNQATSDSSGNYSVSSGLPAGSYYAIALGPSGFSDQLYKNLPCPGGACSPTSGTAITVVAGSDTSGISFNLATCLFCDDFESGQPNPNWTYGPGTWTESGGNLVGTNTKKTTAIARPAFSGCSLCAVQTSMNTAGGPLSLIAFYQDSKNFVELMMKPDKGRWLLKQHVNGKVVVKGKAAKTIDKDTFYNVLILFDGTNLQASLDGVTMITIPAVGTPTGTVGFAVNATIGRFADISVN